MIQSDSNISNKSDYLTTFGNYELLTMLKIGGFLAKVAILPFRNGFLTIDRGHVGSSPKKPEKNWEKNTNLPFLPHFVL